LGRTLADFLWPPDERQGQGHAQYRGREGIVSKRLDAP
jgi:hypothetical protein